MILYKSTAAEFKEAVDDNQISSLIEKSFEEKLGRKAPPQEKFSWINSLSFMERVVRKSGVADDCGILVEYVIPNTSNRIDFIISGKDEEKNSKLIIIELKQWDKAQKIEGSDGVVKTFLGGGLVETSHPSYQASSYKYFIEDFNEAVSKQSISINACAYLHNYPERDPEPLKDKIYAEEIQEAPLFLRDDSEKLEKFLQNHVGEGAGMDILYEIKHGRIKPNKTLIDSISEMHKGNDEFTLLDNQKVAFETAKRIATTTEDKSVVIIKGGPGTGKSVISVNLLGKLLQEDQNVIFVAPNASFRDVMIEELSKDRTKKKVKHLFKGSSNFVDVEENLFDTLVVDEAHRLKGKSAFMYQGENQVEDIVKAAQTSIFFIDDYQAIRPEDIGSIYEIKRVAELYGANIKEIELEAQFRCAGAEGYVNWLDDVLHIKETANYDGWDKEDFEFKIFSDPNKLKDAIHQKDEEGYKARLLAGYAWEWTKKENPDADVEDVEIPEFDFSMPWNSRRLGTTWAIEDEGLEQIGCIHTSQGLEFDYVGIIIGEDLRFNSEELSYYTNWEDYKDRKGKQGLKQKPKELNKLVRNIYKILLSRGMKGCYVYFRDKEVEKYFKERM